MSENRFGCVGQSIRISGGRWFSLSDPSPDNVDSNTIAVALAKECRFTNQLPLGVHYSVAEHSVLCYKEAYKSFPNASPATYLAVLLHDASEAYTGDLSSPLKQALGSNIKYLEGMIQAAVELHYGLNNYDMYVVKRCDQMLYREERITIFHDDPVLLPEVRATPQTQQKLQFWDEVAAHYYFTCCLNVALRKFNAFKEDPKSWDNDRSSVPRKDPIVAEELQPAVETPS